MKMYFIITNISKRTNVRKLIQVAIAYGCQEILVIGQKSFLWNTNVGNTGNDMNSTTATTTTLPSMDTDLEKSSHDIADATSDDTATSCHQNNHGIRMTDIPKHLLSVFQSGHVTIRHFHKWNDCLQYIQQHAILLIGIEIHDTSKTIHEICHDISSHNYHHRYDLTTDDHIMDDRYCIHSHFNNQIIQNVAFIVGNEGTGLHDKQLMNCHQLCRIPQYGTGTASFNVYVASSIIIYHFCNYIRSLPNCDDNK